jgi:hypothetical protein
MCTLPQVVVWDIRVRRCAARQLGAYGPAKHPVLATFRLHDALADVPGLAQQTIIPWRTAVTLTSDPCDPRRVAFSLGCGWHGT